MISAGVSGSSARTSTGGPDGSVPSSTRSGELSDMMCDSSRSPIFGLIGTTGTPASSAPTIATTVSTVECAHTATRDTPSSPPATERAWSASSRYVSDRSGNRSAISSVGEASAGINIC